jgi:membrane protease YdiL (CAAX protease family)
MFAMGLLCGFVYWKWRQLWPLILAHSLQIFLRAARDLTPGYAIFVIVIAIELL